MDGTLGKVSNIGIRSSTIRTFDGAEVVAPNDDLIGARVVNWTLSDNERRVTMPVGVAYGTNPEEVLAVLRRLAAEHPRILNSPEPIALFRGFGESALDFELRYFVYSPDILQVPSEICVAVDKAFAEAGIEIAFPQRDLHLRSVAEGVFPPGNASAPAGTEG
jgi:small-conductance mechanosensitive channel